MNRDFFFSILYWWPFFFLKLVGRGPEIVYVNEIFWLLLAQTQILVGNLHFIYKRKFWLVICQNHDTRQLVFSNKVLYVMEFIIRKYTFQTSLRPLSNLEQHQSTFWKKKMHKISKEFGQNVQNNDFCYNFTYHFQKVRKGQEGQLNSTEKAK